MTKYLLDTNIISYLADKKSPKHPSVSKKIASLNYRDELSISILSLYEYEYGIANSDKTIAEKLRHTKGKIIERLEIVPLTLQGAKVFGEIKAAYKKKIGVNEKAIERLNLDIIIASSAITENAVLVSNDSIFEAIKEIRKDLNLENWTEIKSNT